MAEEVRTDPVELTRLADQMLRSSQRLADTWRAARGSLAVPADAFGDSDAAGAVRRAHAETVDEADVVSGRLVGVLEGDMDRLYRIAFAYQALDDEEARKIRRLHRNIPF